MKDVIKFLDGKKTYLAAAALAVAGLLLGLGVIDKATFEKVYVVILPAALAFLRQAVK